MAVSVKDFLDAIRGRYQDEPNKVEVTGSKVEVVKFDKSNKLPSTSVGHYEIRDTGLKQIFVPQIINRNGSYLGVFEQTILIESTLNKPITVLNMQVSFLNNGTPANVGLIPHTVGNGVPNDPTRVFYTPEKTEGTANTNDKRVVLEVPELRTPVHGFEFSIMCNEAPTSGEIYFIITRRY